ncbi:PREDICTED: uncharacterized protein LOC109147769 [Ipomoea nil]|uniref:uncharacterized protein LOC109147769 n=1 Tax=Ipomoea nil TaxID=35883 RepID=UPI0009015178|nr:PREDICTED: uncharacterized protein LOC109147769 [Ipomoea nil]
MSRRQTGGRRRRGGSHRRNSPVVKPTIVRLLLSLAVLRGWSVRLLDIHNAFLNDDLAETVYMRQPPGYEDKTLPNHVCLLQCSLYGLKQAPRAWFTRLHNFLVTVGFTPSKTDVSLFIYSHSGVQLYFFVYMDDILVMSSDLVRVADLVAKMALEFKRYMKDILKRAGIVDCKPISTPVSLVRSDDATLVPFADPTHYRSLGGALQYLTHMHAPTTADWSMLKRVLRYVKGTLGFGLRIQKSMSVDIHAFSDSDWAGNPDDQ